MDLLFSSSSMRPTLPRQEIRRLDRRSGAYPTKKRTGDSTRTGRNKYFFDDARTVVFATSSIISVPTTFRSGSLPLHLSRDLTSSLYVTGNTLASAVDPWISHREQIEVLGPFIEHKLFEQDETNVVNSVLMTGSAFSIAPDRFKSKISNKTIIRIAVPLSTISTLSPLSSSLHYLNPAAGVFDKVIDEVSTNINNGVFPATFAPLPFTPYGFHHLVLNDSADAALTDNDAKSTYKRATTFNGDGSDYNFFNDNPASVFRTCSVLNPSHRASSAQSINLSQYLAHPFLLEKAVIEFPFQAGAGWLNDRFGIRQVASSDIQFTIDAGGPLITCALMRQDKTDSQKRDVIASGTITNQLDMTTGSYQICSTSWASRTDVVISPEGLGFLVNPSVVITGSSLSGSTNSYSGSVKLILEPQVTSHVWRLRASGSSDKFFTIPYTASGAGARRTQAIGINFGPISRRSSKYIESSRNFLGNQFALIEPNKLDGTLNPVREMDSQYESLGQKDSSPRFFTSKVYHDVVSKTVKSPYLLHPNDNLVVLLNKHRAVGSPVVSDWSPWSPIRVVAEHDVKIPTGTLYLTLYGDLIRNDTEFHDTLNQRLETEELWETVGEEPVLDQFDVSYMSELSGSYIDKFSAKSFDQFFNFSTNRTEALKRFSHFASSPDEEQESLSTEFNWSRHKKMHEFMKNTRALKQFSTNEQFWDTRLPSPKDIILTTNPSFKLGYVLTIGYEKIYNIIKSLRMPTIAFDGRVDKWWMAYPFEPLYAAARSSMTPWISDEFGFGAYGGDDGDASNNWKTLHKYADTAFVVPNIETDLGIRGEVKPADGNISGVGLSEFVKYFYGFGDGYATGSNQFIYARGYTYNEGVSYCADIRGWKYGLMNGFPVKTSVVFRRDRFGQPRDMLEQRLDAKFYDSDEIPVYGGTIGVRTGPVQVKFYNFSGSLTDPLRTLSSNLSFEATSSMPFADGHATNRPEFDYSILNIASLS